MRASSTLSSARVAGGDRAHERLVAVAEVGVHHVEVALADRHVDRLAHRAAGVVEVRRQVRELDEVLEVVDRRVAPAVVEVDARTASRSSARTRWRRRRSARRAPGCGRAGCTSPAPWPARSARHMPRGKRTRVAVDVGAGVGEERRAPTGSRGSRCRPRSRIVSALCSMHLEPLLDDDLERLHRPREERLARRRRARRASPGAPARPPPRRAPPEPSCSDSSLITWSSRRRRRRRARPSRRGRCGGQRDQRREVRWWARGVRERHRGDEQLLEPRLGGGLDLDRPSRTACSDLAPRCTRQQRPHRAGAGGVADRAHAVERAVGHQPEHHRVQRVDVRAERAGQAHVGRPADRRRARCSRSMPARSAALASWIGAHVVLGDRQLGRRRRRTARSEACGRRRRRAVLRSAFAPTIVPSRVDHAGEVHLGDRRR